MTVESFSRRGNLPVIEPSRVIERIKKANEQGHRHSVSYYFGREVIRVGKERMEKLKEEFEVKLRYRYVHDPEAHAQMKGYFRSRQLENQGLILFGLVTSAQEDYFVDGQFSLADFITVYNSAIRNTGVSKEPIPDNSASETLDRALSKKINLECMRDLSNAVLVEKRRELLSHSLNLFLDRPTIAPAAEEMTSYIPWYREQFEGVKMVIEQKKELGRR